MWGPKRTFAAAAILLIGLAPNAMAAGPHVQKAPKATPGAPSARVKSYKLDEEVNRRANGNPLHTSSVIVTLAPGASLPPEFKRYARGGKLEIINGQVLDLPNGELKKLAARPNIFRVHDNRPTETFNYRTAVTVGAREAQDTLKLTGAGIGVAVIDSGVTTWHDDLTAGASPTVYPYGNQRVTKFVDFVNGRALPYDDNGHGSHVAGTIIGNGTDSAAHPEGRQSGIAPGASLIALKVLDADGRGTISHILAALGWVAANAKTYNIRVVNMSVGAAIHESYWTDPLTLAAKALTDQGITVVAAAGNFGKNAAGQPQYGGITAPGNAPWVLTVGASSTMGTLTRKDDTLAAYSSRGPAAFDFEAKPDLVAPGTGTISLAVPGSTFYALKAAYLVNGTVKLGVMPYLALSGTSMAAPVVSGTVALMLQANPTLTPNLIKAILQYTAEVYHGYQPLEQGAGFLNTLGAVRLARFYATAKAGDKLPVQKVWSRQLIWGSHRLTGGYIQPTANAWATNIVWGTARTLVTAGDNIVWGTVSNNSDNIVWGTASSDNIVWGTASSDNIVWGTSVNGDNIVWGTASSDNIVWGTDCGGADCDDVVWGTASPVDNIVWGTAAPSDNIVWGTAGLDNIVWATSAEDPVLYPPDEATQPLPDVTLEFGDVVEPTPVTALLSGGGV